MIRRFSAAIGTGGFPRNRARIRRRNRAWWISRWHVASAFLGLGFLRYAGAVLIVLGALGLIHSFIRFPIQGIGTPAPVFPTRHLVVTGLYRYVGNPMYVSVVSVILRQALLFANRELLVYGVLVGLGFSHFRFVV